MRFQYISFIFIFLCPVVSRAQCPPGDIIFSTQQQIYDWAANYPDCSDIPGNVMIGTPYGTTEISDLSPLSIIRTIGGYLNISNNPELVSLQGLENLVTIGGYLNIFNDDGLTTLHGLSNLTSVNGFLWIIHNESLTAPDGLQSLTSINGSIEISHNPQLTALTGLEHIDPRTISPALSFLLTPVIDIKMITNGISVLALPPNFKAYFEKHSVVKRFQNMIHIPYSERPVETDMIYNRIVNLLDSVKVRTILEEISEVAQNSGDEMLQWESDLLTTYYHLYSGSVPFSKWLTRLEDIAERAGRQNVWQIQARALKYMSNRYWNQLRDFERSFMIHSALQEVLERMSPDDFPDMAQCYNLMGLAHYRFRDYRTAIRYFKKGISIRKTPFNETHITHCFNNLGLCYQKLGISDSSDYYFNQILDDTTHYAIRVWEGIASGNLGYNHYLRKEYEDAIPLLQRDVKIAQSLNYWGLAAGSLIPLADINLIQGRLSESDKLIRLAREYIRKSNQNDRLRLLFPVMSKYHSAMGHQGRASDYVDSTLRAIETYNEKFDALKVMRANQALHASELKVKEAERSNLIQQRNWIMTIVMILAVFGVLYQWTVRKNQRRKREIRELMLQNTQESLEHAQERLGDLTRKIRENNHLIHQLKLDQNKNSDSTMLTELQNSTILTKKDWLQFKSTFQQAYPGFLETLNKQYSDLSPAEIRWLCLEKLQLTNFEKASAQGISPKSVNVTQYRIRKKLSLESQEELEKLVHEI